MLRNQLQAGEIDPQEYRLLRRGVALAYSLEQPVRRSARRKVQTEKDAGRLEQPEACSSCGTPGPVEAHHGDYSKPLEVEWLCSACHDRADRELAGRVKAEARR